MTETETQRQNERERERERDRDRDRDRETETERDRERIMKREQGETIQQQQKRVLQITSSLFFFRRVQHWTA